MAYKNDILLCDLDAFFASVEQRDHPEYRGKPIIIGGKATARSVVATCSYEARKFNVRSAMPMYKALKLCPQAIVLPGRMRRYRDVSEQVMDIFQYFTPDIEIVSVDEAYLAVKKGAGIETGKKIRGIVKDTLGLPITVGVSANKLLAKIACELAKPDNIRTLWPEEVQSILWPLLVRVLPGIGPKTEKRLKSAGIETVHQLADAHESILRGILGSSSVAIQQYSRGIDERKLKKAGDAKSISEEMTFPYDVAKREHITAALMELSETVGYRLRSNGLRAKTLTLKLRFADFRTITRSITLSEATDRDSLIYRTVCELFAAHCGRPPWRLLGIRTSGFEKLKQLSLLSPSVKEQKEEQITIVTDKLKGRYGQKIICKARRLRKQQKP